MPCVRLANDLAAIMGELERIDAALAELTARRARLEIERIALVGVGEVVGLERLQQLVPAVRVHAATAGGASLPTGFAGF